MTEDKKSVEETNWRARAELAEARLRDAGTMEARMDHLLDLARPMGYNPNMSNELGMPEVLIRLRVEKAEAALAEKAAECARLNDEVDRLRLDGREALLSDLAAKDAQIVVLCSALRPLADLDSGISLGPGSINVTLDIKLLKAAKRACAPSTALDTSALTEALKAEREACAVVAENYPCVGGQGDAECIAEAIRRRGGGVK